VFVDTRHNTSMITRTTVRGMNASKLPVTSVTVTGTNRAVKVLNATVIGGIVSHDSDSPCAMCCVWTHADTDRMASVVEPQECRTSESVDL
jgi:hypothetical protein